LKSDRSSKEEKKNEGEGEPALGGTPRSCGGFLGQRLVGGGSKKNHRRGRKRRWEISERVVTQETKTLQYEGGGKHKKRGKKVRTTTKGKNCIKGSGGERKGKYS